MILSLKIIYSLLLMSLMVYSSVSQSLDENINSKKDITDLPIPNIPNQDNNEDKIKATVKEDVNNIKDGIKRLLVKKPRGLNAEESANLPEKSTEQIKPSVSSSPLQILFDCKGNLDCAEEKFVLLIDRVDSERSIPLFFNLVSLEKTKEDPKDKKEPETGNINEALVSRMNRYLRSHSLRFPVLGQAADSTSQSLDFRMDSLAVASDGSEGRSRSRWLKILLPVIFVAELSFWGFVPFFMALLAVFSGVALQAGLGAIALSAFLGLKSLLSSEKDKRDTRVTVVKPHVIPDVYHSDLLHGWSRSSLLDSYRGGYNPPVDPYRGYGSSSWDRPAVR